MRKDVGIIIVNGTEDIELFTPLDLLTRAEARVILISAEKPTSNSKPLIITKCGIKVDCDKCLYDKNIEDTLQSLGAIIIPGGQIDNGFATYTDADKLPKHLETLRNVLLEKSKDSEFLIGALCAAPGLVLERWGVINPNIYRYTGYPGTSKNLTGSQYELSSPEGNATLITANSPSAALVFGLFIVSVIFDTNRSDSIASDILFFSSYY